MTMSAGTPATMPAIMMRSHGRRNTGSMRGSSPKMTPRIRMPDMMANCEGCTMMLPTLIHALFPPISTPKASTATRPPMPARYIGTQAQRTHL